MRVIALTAIILAGCGASAEIRTRYATEVSRCIANERAIIDRQGTSYEPRSGPRVELGFPQFLFKRCRRVSRVPIRLCCGTSWHKGQCLMWLSVMAQTGSQ